VCGQWWHFVWGVIADGHIWVAEVRVLSLGGVARVLNKGLTFLCQFFDVEYTESACGLGGDLTNGELP